MKKYTLRSPRRLRSRLRLDLLAVAAAAAPVVLAQSVRAGNDTYVGGATGLWSSASNWSPASVPASGDSVFLNNSSGLIQTITYNVTGTGVALNSMTINATGGAGTGNDILSMAANTLTVAQSLDVGQYGSGTVNLSGGNFSSGTTLVNTGSVGSPYYTGFNTIIGDNGTGVFNQSGGTVNASIFYDSVNNRGGQLGSETLGNLIIGNAAVARGTYILSSTSGAATLNSYGDETVASSATGSGGNPGGTFTQYAGTTNYTGAAIRVGLNAGSNGLYTLNGGNVSAGALVVGEGGTGTFTQTGGTASFLPSASGDQPGFVTGDAEFTIGSQQGGSGIYNLGGSGTLVINGVGSGDGPATIGLGGTGVFNQTSVNSNATFTTGLIIGSRYQTSYFNPVTYANGTGTLNLSAGTLTVPQSLDVGQYGSGTVNLSGGNFSSGTTLVNTGSVGSPYYTGFNTIIGDNGTGVFNQSGGTVNASIFYDSVNNRGGQLGSETLGNLIIGNAAGARGTYILSSTSGAATLNSYGDEIVASSATGSGGNPGGTFTQYAGTTNYTGAAIRVGLNAGSNGLYTLNGGNVSAGALVVGEGGTGTFTQTGGTANFLPSANGDQVGFVTGDAEFTIGSQQGSSGVYNLGGSGTLVINGVGSGDGPATIGLGGTGVFNQTSVNSNATFTTGLVIGSRYQTSYFPPVAYANGTGTLNLSAGTLTVPQSLDVGQYGSGTVNLSGGNLSAGSMTVGDSGTGVFNQTGGTNTIGTPGTPGNLYIGNQAGATGSYYLGSAGSQLTVNGNLYVGYNYLATGVGGAYGNGTFTQTNGAVSAASVQIGAGSSYSLQGGTVSTATLNLDQQSSSFSQTTGTLNAGTISLTGNNASLALTDYVLGSSGANGTSITAGLTLPTGTVVTGVQPTLTAHSITVNTGGSFTEPSSGGLLATVGTFTINGGTVQLWNVDVDNGGSVAGDVSTDVQIATFNLISGSFTAAGGTVSETVGNYGTGVFNQSGGTHTIGTAGAGSPQSLYIGVNSGSNGTYLLSGASSVLTVNGSVFVGYYGAGSVIQSGGVVNAIVTDASWSLDIGTNDGSSGSYTLGVVGGGTSDGTLNATNEIVGDQGTGQFTQLSGTNVASVLAIAGGTFTGFPPQQPTGTYTLVGGNLNASSEMIGYGSTRSGYFNQSGGSNTVSSLQVNQLSAYNLGGGTLTVGGSEFLEGAFTQTGGYHTVAALEVSGGNYTLSTTGSGTSTLAAVNEYVGYDGAPSSFNQTGGTNTISNGLNLIYGTYTLSGTGNLSAGSETIAADHSAGFVQTGGVHSVTGLMDFGSGDPSVGTYTLSGASSQLSAGSITLGDNGAGVFTQTGGSVTVSGTLLLGNLYLTQNGFLNSSVGNYTMNGSGSTLTANTEIIGNGGATGIGGYGTFIQYNGTNTVNSNFSIGAIVSGYGADYNFYSGDSYDIKGGVLNLPTSTTGAYNYGQFTVDGGIVNGYLNNPVNPNNPTIGTNTLTLNGGNFAGTLNTAAVVNMNAGANFSGTLINVGTFNQNGGTVTGVVQNGGTYNLYAGTFNASNGITTAVNGNGSFYQYGGTIGSATFVNSGTFDYYGGTISGRVINQGLFDVLTTGIVFGNGLENDAYLDFASNTVGVVATFNGQGLDNFGTISLPAGQALAGTIINDYGGTLSGEGTLTGTLNNLGTFTPGNGFTVGGLLTNSGIIGPLSGATYYSSASLLKAAGGLINTGQIQLTGGQITGGTIVNNPGGVIEFSQSGTGTTVSGFSQAVNNSGGVIEIGSGTLVTFASFAAGNTNGGDIQIANNSTATFATAFPNSGTIELEGSSAALNGGAISNSGSITGLGRISNAILNSGTIESKSGLLQISAAGSTNLTGGQIIADAGTTVQYSQGLATNSGTITLFGGTFDNNSRPMISTGLINGSGTFRTGGTGLNNSAGAIIDITAGTSFFGPVYNSGYITAYGSTNTFYGNVTDAAGGTIKVTNGTIYFLGNTGATVSGWYNSDPSDNYFNNLTTTTTGIVTGGTGDRFFLINGTIFTNAGTFHDAGTLSAGTVANSGTFVQTGTLVETGNFTDSGTATIGGTQNWSHGTVFTNTAGNATFQSDAGATAANLSVHANGGSVIFASTQHLAGLSIGAGSTVQITGGGSGHRSVVYTPTFADTGTLDLTGNDLDIQAGGAAALASVTPLIAQGYNGGAWTGTGVTSSSAAGDNSHLTAVGAILNAFNSSTPLYTSLDSAPVALNDVLVKYTWYGDTNLDGKVDGSDYSRIDNGYQSNGALTGWYNGDFNYDGVIDGSDYTLIDNAFNTQGAQLAAAVASPTAQISGEIAGTSAVPEPATLGLLGIGAAGLLGRRARRRRV